MRVSWARAQVGGVLFLLGACVGAPPPAPSMTEGSTGPGPASSSGPGVDPDTTGASTGPSTAGPADTGSSTSDDGADDGSSSSSSSGTAGELPVWPSDPFGEPVLVDVSDLMVHDEDPTLTGDQLEIYFASQRGGDGGGGPGGSRDIYGATRPRIGAAFGVPVAVDELNSDSFDGSPEVSDDGLWMMLASNRAGGTGQMDIYLSQRRARGDPWSVPIHVSELSTPDAESAATLSYALGQVTWCSNRPGGAGGMDLWTVSVDLSGLRPAFEGPMPIAPLNTADNECGIFISPDERVAVFDSNRSGNLDLWMATRDDPDADFDAPVPLDEVNLAKFADSDPWVSPDGRVLYFTSAREGLRRNIYRAER